MVRECADRPTSLPLPLLLWLFFGDPTSGSRECRLQEMSTTVSFADLLKRAVPASRWGTPEIWKLSAVALSLDATAVHLARSQREWPKQYFAVIKNATEDEGTKALYTLTTTSRELAFYMMCLDACDREWFSDGKDLVADLDPEYRTLDVLCVLQDVGERAQWEVARLWGDFVEFCDSGEIEPYEIVDATPDHYVTREFVRDA